MKYKNHIPYHFLLAALLLPVTFPGIGLAAYRFIDFQAKAPIHSKSQISQKPLGLTPDQIKSFYNLPKSGGHGTIAIIDVGENPTIENDLATFAKQFNLPACTIANKCFEKHVMDKGTVDQGWGLETAMDVEWAHAIAPQAKILLVEAKTASAANLMNAVDYARGRSDVVAVSMSWGGDEFSDEVAQDYHFVSPYGASFFASSGDEGAGAEWPASSPNVVAVGGTHLNISKAGKLLSETAWDGSGGGISKYEAMPAYQAHHSRRGIQCRSRLRLLSLSRRRARRLVHHRRHLCGRAAMGCNTVAGPFCQQQELLQGQGPGQQCQLLS